MMTGQAQWEKNYTTETNRHSNEYIENWDIHDDFLHCKQYSSIKILTWIPSTSGSVCLFHNILYHGK